MARGPFIEDFYQCVTHGFYTAKWQEQFYTTFTMIFTFLLPLSILFITCISTFAAISSEICEFSFYFPSNNCSCIIFDLESEKIFFDVMFIEQSQQQQQQFKKQRRRRRSSLHSNRQRIIQKAKMRSLQISLVIILAFLICWIPYNMMMLIFMFWQPNEEVILTNNS